MSKGKRQGKKFRKTGETQIAVTLGLDGKGSAKVKTGIPFFDHMLNLLRGMVFLIWRLRRRGIWMWIFTTRWRMWELCWGRH